MAAGAAVAIAAAPALDELLLLPVDDAPVVVAAVAPAVVLPEEPPEAVPVAPARDPIVVEPETTNCPPLTLLGEDSPKPACCAA